MTVQNSFNPEESGERQELDELFSLAYEELRRLASTVKRGDPGNTLAVRGGMFLSKSGARNEAKIRYSNRRYQFA